MAIFRILCCLGMLTLVVMPAQAVDKVLMVSIDALHPDALRENVAPGLHALRTAGQYTPHGRSVDPPKTLIAHTAMLTGLTPEQHGKRNNDWRSGEVQVKHSTLFDDLKALGFGTAYYYAKPKLGYLATPAVDEHALIADGGTHQAMKFLRQEGRRSVFLHVSGLEYAGTQSGWLSPDYLVELSYIDMMLEPLFAQVRQGGNYLIVVVSDHAGHDRTHGTRHPEDYKLPLLVLSDTGRIAAFPNGTWPVTDLRRLVRDYLASRP